MRERLGLDINVETLTYQESGRADAAEWLTAHGWQVSAVSNADEMARLGRPIPADLAEEAFTTRPHNPADDDGVFYADITGPEASDRGSLRLEELLETLPPRSASTSTSRPRWRTQPASATAPQWASWPLL